MKCSFNAFRNLRSLHFLYQVTLLLLLMAFFGFWAVLLGQDANWDLRNYHWYSAYAFLHHRLNWDIDPGQLQNYFNPLLDVVNYFIIQYAPTPKVAEFFLGTFQGVAVYFFLRIAILVIKTDPLWLRLLSIILALAIGVTGVASFSQIGTTFNEPQIAAFVMAALFLSIKAINENDNETKRFYWWLSSAFVLGLGLGLKLTAISYVLGFFVALLFYSNTKGIILKLVFCTGITFCMGFLLTDGFWLWTLYNKFHNPFFPMYNKIFHSPYVSLVSNFIDKRHVPADFKSFWVFPFWGQVTTSPLHHVLSPAHSELDRRLAMAIILGILTLLFFWMRKTRENIQLDHSSLKFLLVFFFVSYGVWLTQFGNYRYFIPINFLSGLFIICFCLLLFRSSLSRVIFSSAFAFWIIFTTSQPELERIPYGKRFFEVKVPAIPPHSVIILLGEEPLAYIAPYFPADTRFVGFYNMLVKPENTLLYQQALKVMLQSNQPLYAMGYKHSFKQLKSFLEQCTLKISDECLLIRSNVIPEEIPLCPVMSAGRG